MHKRSEKHLTLLLALTLILGAVHATAGGVAAESQPTDMGITGKIVSISGSSLALYAAEMSVPTGNIGTPPQGGNPGQGSMPPQGGQPSEGGQQQPGGGQPPQDGQEPPTPPDGANGQQPPDLPSGQAGPGEFPGITAGGQGAMPTMEWTFSTEQTVYTLSQTTEVFENVLGVTANIATGQLATGDVVRIWQNDAGEVTRIERMQTI